MTTTEETGAKVGGLTLSQYRRAWGRIPTSVVIVAATIEDQPVGMVIGTFSPVSLRPPLVGFYGDLRSRTLPQILRSDVWSFNVLDQNDLAVADSFRRPPDRRFDDVDWHISNEGTPHIASAILTIDARAHAITDAGDHKAVLAEVLGVSVGDHVARPLVFQAGRLARLDPGQMIDRGLWQLGWGS